MHYHVWFLTKYRAQTIILSVERELKEVFLEIIGVKKYNILEIETNLDHVHLLVETADKKELASIVRTIKAVSAKRILDNCAMHKKHFWAKRYGFKQVKEEDIENVRRYIRNQKKIPHA